MHEACRAAGVCLMVSLARMVPAAGLGTMQGPLSVEGLADGLLGRFRAVTAADVFKCCLGTAARWPQSTSSLDDCDRSRHMRLAAGELCSSIKRQRCTDREMRPTLASRLQGPQALSLDGFGWCPLRWKHTAALRSTQGKNDAPGAGSSDGLLYRKRHRTAAKGPARGLKLSPREL